MRRHDRKKKVGVRNVMFQRLEKKIRKKNKVEWNERKEEEEVQRGELEGEKEGSRKKEGGSDERIKTTGLKAL